MLEDPLAKELRRNARRCIRWVSLIGMLRLEASRGRPKYREARFARSVEGMEGLFSDCRRASESIAELHNVRERLRKIETQILSGWQELWRRITGFVSEGVDLVKAWEAFVHKSHSEKYVAKP